MTREQNLKNIGMFEDSRGNYNLHGIKITRREIEVVDEVAFNYLICKVKTRKLQYIMTGIRQFIAQGDNLRITDEYKN